MTVYIDFRVPVKQDVFILFTCFSRHIRPLSGRRKIRKKKSTLERRLLCTDTKFDIMLTWFLSQIVE